MNSKGDGHYEEPTSPFFSAWAAFVLKYRWLLLVLMAALTAWSIVQIRTSLYVDNSVEAFFSNESDTVTTLEETRDLFGRDSLFLVMIEGDVFTEPFLRRLERVHHELKALDIDVPSLGERKSDRDERRTCGALGEPDPTPDNSVVTGTERIAVDDFEDDAEFEEDPSESAPGEAGEPSNAGFEGEGSIVEEVVSLINARHIWSEQVGPDESPTLHVDKLMDPLPESIGTTQGEHVGEPNVGGSSGGQGGPFCGHRDPHRLYERARFGAGVQAGCDHHRQIQRRRFSCKRGGDAGIGGVVEQSHVA